MKTASLLLTLAGLFFAVPSCKDGGTPDVNCDRLITGVANLDENVVNAEINHLASDLEPHPTANDNIGHEDNLQTLVDRLNSDCSGISATIECYVCVFSLPPQSLVRVTVDSSGQSVQRIISILTPGDGYMESLSIR